MWYSIKVTSREEDWLRPLTFWCSWIEFLDGMNPLSKVCFVAQGKLLLSHGTREILELNSGEQSTTLLILPRTFKVLFSANSHLHFSSQLLNHYFSKNEAGSKEKGKASIVDSDRLQLRARPFCSWSTGRQILIGLRRQRTHPFTPDLQGPWCVYPWSILGAD